LDIGTDGIGTPVVGGAGAVATGVPRVTLASDDPAVAKLGTIDTDTGNMVTALQLLDNAIDGNYLNTNLNFAGTDAQIGEGAISASTLRVTLATDDDGVAHLATIAGDTTNIETAIQLLDNAVYVDDADWTDNTSSHLLVGGIYQSTDHTVTDGDVSPFQVDVNGCIVLGTGAKAIGKLAANDGVDIGNVDITSIIPLTGATNLGKARDVACGANDVGVMALAVRDDTLTTLTPADGDYVPLRVSSTGQLHVTGAGGGTEYTEDVVTANPQVGSAIMVERDDALTTVTPAEADWIGLRGTAEGALWVQDFNSDAALALLGTIDTDTGVIAGDTTSIDGKITACNTGAVVISSGTVTANLGATDNAVLDQIELNTDPLLVVGGGAEATAIRITIANDSTGVVSVDDGGGTLTVDGTVTANLSATDNAVLDTIDAVLDTIDADTGAIKLAIEIMDDWDATHASAAPADGPQIMGAAYSTALPTDVGADADAARICTDRHGRILSGVMPQNFQATFTSADAQAAAPVKAKTADRKMYILSLVVSVDTAMNVQFQDDTGPTVLIEGMYFAANGGAHLTWPAEAP
ncbi:hypothetical protein KAU11_06275, partial [Candidatus Babeliales bacterium]|nr:hypothetical protein [Candidatus Babeliales bacterium]